ITEYEMLIDELLQGLAPHNHGVAIELASLPDEIRGFGHVKMRNLTAVRTRWAMLLAQFRAPAQTRAA
ncbi:MAG TPA: DUF6537 domain-containing protein, partial [Burkholderiaceae bacterium]|nr:DUF6537 domain-containing protein [Burkholderiaceae bacterium]